jgi:UDP:flavonoid glycosyltransferase YjiC (YdhE family)
MSPMIVLFPNCSFLSETTRMLDIARALQARGAGVAIASHGGTYEHILDGSEFPWRRLAPGLSRDQAMDFVERLVNLGLGGEPLLSQAFVRGAVAAEAELLRETNADMAVTGFNLTSFLSSRVAGVPLAASHGGAFVPPVFERNLAPNPVNPPLAATGWLPDSLGRRIANFIPPRLRQPVNFLNKAAGDLEVEPVPSVAALMCGDLTLVTELPDILGISREELETWRPTSPHYRSGTRLRYVGPLFARLARPIPPAVRAFLDRPGPLIYVAPTSVTEKFLRGLVRAIQAAGERALVAATIHDISDLADERTCIAGLLPNHRLMPEADIVVTMGGQGSVQCAMASGTPIIGFPFHGEQELNLALAERQGMGVRLPPKAAGTPKLTRAVRQMLSDPGAKRNAARVQALYEGVDGAANAADAILSYLGDSPPK